MSTRKAATPRRSTRRQPDALRMLKDDHDKVKALFEKFADTRRDGKKKGEIAQTICKELTIHTKLEEEIFYPAVRAAIDDADVMNEALVEHAAAKDLIGEIEKMSPDEDMFDAKVTVLGEFVNHHIREEQNEMFPQVRKTDLDLNALADTMRSRKQQLTGKSEAEEAAA